MAVISSFYVGYLRVYSSDAFQMHAVNVLEDIALQEIVKKVS